jgi:L-iditol 2-dehydrogenase
LGEFDVVVECSGSGEGAETALRHARKGGRYVQIGIFGKPILAPLDALVLNELSVRTGYATTPPTWRQALALIARRDVILQPLVSEVAPLADFRRVFYDLRAGRAAKIIFDPRMQGGAVEAAMSVSRGERDEAS